MPRDATPKPVRIPRAIFMLFPGPETHTEFRSFLRTIAKSVLLSTYTGAQHPYKHPACKFKSLNFATWTSTCSNKFPTDEHSRAKLTKPQPT